MQQLNFEIATTSNHKCKQLDELKEDLLEPCLLSLYSQIDGYPTDREDQQEIVDTWNTLDKEETMWKCLSTVFSNQRVTVQQLLGVFWNTLDLEIGQRKARVMEPFFLALKASPLIDFEKIGVEFFFSTELKLEGEYGYVLPSLDVPEATNKSIGYKSLTDHVITGHPLKQHDKEICLDHINRLNAIPYRIETRLLMFKPEFNPEPKIKSNGSYETPLDIQKRKESFQHYSETLPERVRLILAQGNKFHLCHRYDTRLRTYVKAFQFDYIGQKYSRAIVQPLKGEVVEGVNYDWF